MELNFLDRNSYKKLIKENNKIDNGHVLYGLTTTIEKIEKFESQASCTLSDYYRKYLQQFSPMGTIIWSDEHLRRGSTYLTSLADMLSGSPYSGTIKKAGERHKGLLWEAAEKDEKIIEQLEQKYYIFDIICIWASTFTLVEFNQKNERLFLYTYPHFLFPLTLDIQGYLEHVDKLKGTLLWQEQFIDKKKCSEQCLKELQSWRKENSSFIVNKVFNDLHGKNDYSGDFDFVKLGIKHDYYSRLKKSFNTLSQKIQAKGGELKYGHPRLKAGKILNIQIIRKIETILQWKLPDEFLAFYSQINGLQIDWTFEGLKINKNFPSSSLHILPLEQVFGGSEPHKNRVWHDTIWEDSVTFSGTMDENVLEFAKQCRPIIFSTAGDGVTILIHINHDKQNFDLYLDPGEGDGKYYPLDVSFTDFINSLIDVAGLNHWMILNKFNRTMPQDMLKVFDPVSKYIEALFPEVSLDDYFDV